MGLCCNISGTNQKEININIENIDQEGKNQNQFLNDKWGKSDEKVKGEPENQKLLRFPKNISRLPTSNSTQGGQDNPEANQKSRQHKLSNTDNKSQFAQIIIYNIEDIELVLKHQNYKIKISEEGESGFSNREDKKLLNKVSSHEAQENVNIKDLFQEEGLDKPDAYNLVSMLEEIVNSQMLKGKNYLPMAEGDVDIMDALVLESSQEEQLNSYPLDKSISIIQGQEDDQVLEKLDLKNIQQDFFDEEEKNGRQNNDVYLEDNTINNQNETSHYIQQRSLNAQRLTYISPSQNIYYSRQLSTFSKNCQCVEIHNKNEKQIFINRLPSIKQQTKIKRLQYIKLLMD